MVPLERGGPGVPTVRYLQTTQDQRSLQKRSQKCKELSIVQLCGDHIVVRQERKETPPREP